VASKNVKWCRLIWATLYNAKGYTVVENVLPVYDVEHAAFSQKHVIEIGIVYFEVIYCKSPFPLSKM